MTEAFIRSVKLVTAGKMQFQVVDCKTGKILRMASCSLPKLVNGMRAEAAGSHKARALLARWCMNNGVMMVDEPKMIICEQEDTTARAVRLVEEKRVDRTLVILDESHDASPAIKAALLDMRSGGGRAAMKRQDFVTGNQAYVVLGGEWEGWVEIVSIDDDGEYFEFKWPKDVYRGITAPCERIDASLSYIASLQEISYDRSGGGR